MTSAERKRYGIYFQPKGEANDADLELDITRLQYVPSLRWVATPVQEGDYDAPAIPASDPRFFEDSDRAGAGAHFGFLVWTGISFELREKVPYALWPCKRAGLERSDCLSAHDRGHDRYIIDDKAAKQEGEQP